MSPGLPVVGSASIPLQTSGVTSGSNWCQAQFTDKSLPGWLLCFWISLVTLGRWIYLQIVNSLIQNCGNILPLSVSKIHFSFRAGRIRNFLLPVEQHFLQLVSACLIYICTQWEEKAIFNLRFNISDFQCSSSQTCECESRLPMCIPKFMPKLSCDFSEMEQWGRKDGSVTGLACLKRSVWILEQRWCILVGFSSLLLCNYYTTARLPWQFANPPGCSLAEGGQTSAKCSPRPDLRGCANCQWLWSWSCISVIFRRHRQPEQEHKNQRFPRKIKCCCWFAILLEKEREKNTSECVDAKLLLKKNNSIDMQ